MILPILYSDVVALARARMAAPNDRDLVRRLCDRSNRKGICLEDATHRLDQVDGFSLNCNRGLAALAQVSLEILAWRRENNLP